MAELKTRKNDGDVDAFLDAIEDDTKREDSKAIRALMEEVTGTEAAMWGDSIVGFGERHMVYPSGRELDWFLVGFSPRKQNLTLYIMDGFEEYAGILSGLGKHSTGKSCLYVKRLSDIDTGVLRELVESSVRHLGQ